MPKKIAAKMRPDVNENAYRVMLEATGQAPKTDPANRAKNADAVKRGAKGGTARATSLSPTKRKSIAKKAAAKRWS
jgi:hypothetical protein